LVSLLAGVALGLWWSGGPDEVSVTSGAQLALPFPPDARLASGSFLTAFTFSPDGGSLAYVGVGADGVRRLYIRPLDEDRARVLPGTEGAEGPFFSPDGEWIAFWSPWKLSKVRASGSGVPQTICDSRDFRGGTWAGDTIVFTPGQGTELLRVPDSGGEPERFTTLLEGEGGHRFPHALPDGDTILFSARLPAFDADRAMLATMSLSSGERKDIGKASVDARVSPSGHLFYVQTGRLNAVPFDLERLEITGTARVLVDDVVVGINTGAAQFAVGAQGQLAWIPGDLVGDDVRISRVDRSGSSTPIEDWNHLARHPHLSPDVSRALLMVIGPDVGGIWVMSTDGSVRRRLPSTTGVGVWATEEQWIGNATEGKNWRTLFLDSIDGSIPRRDLLDSPDLRDVSPSSVSAEGVLAFNYMTPEGSLDAGTLPLAGTNGWTPLLEGPADEGGVVFSPDGRYIAYVSNRSGQFEVYVTDYPNRSATWQLSTTGGSEVVWRDDGREIYFRSGNDLVAVPVTLDPRFEPGSPQVLFRGGYEGVLGRPEMPNYDAAPDGSWFLMLESPEISRSEESVRLAFDWPRMLEQQ
ncbi:MAG: hypothetical protein R3324_02385, partial [Halobacteriales archaeon]|nr:hypothetical protein [Halobacteriales archaeon]